LTCSAAIYVVINFANAQLNPANAVFTNIHVYIYLMLLKLISFGYITEPLGEGYYVIYFLLRPIRLKPLIRLDFQSILARSICLIYHHK